MNEGLLTVTGDIDKLAAALAKAQAVMTNPAKNKQGQSGGGKYMYADLSAVIDAARKPLAENGLSITQYPTMLGDRFVLVTRLMHESGQMQEGIYPLPLNATEQQKGSAITYGRRYSYCAMTGQVGDDDDDGYKASSAKSEDETARNDLVERMGSASLGNGAVMAYCKANGLGDGKTVEDLPIASVQHLLSGWDSIVAAIKATKPADTKAKSAPAAEPAEKKPEQPPAGESAPGDMYAGIDAELVALMQADGITPDELRAYYSTPRGNPPVVMLPGSPTPDKMPAKFLEKIKLPANWKSVVGKIKGTK